jgi:hypothetical protein
MVELMVGHTVHNHVTIYKEWCVHMVGHTVGHTVHNYIAVDKNRGNHTLFTLHPW